MLLWWCVPQVSDFTMPSSLHDIRYLGFIDVGDVACAVLTTGLTKRRAGTWLSKLSELMVEDPKYMVDNAINLSGRNAFYAVGTGESLLRVRTDADPFAPCCLQLCSNFAVKFPAR